MDAAWYYIAGVGGASIPDIKHYSIKVYPLFTASPLHNLLLFLLCRLGVGMGGLGWVSKTGDC